MTIRAFLTFPDPASADQADAAVQDYLRVRFSNKGSRWSGTFTNGTLYGILWASEVSAALSLVAPDPTLKVQPKNVANLVTEDADKPWADYVPPQPAP